MASCSKCGYWSSAICVCNSNRKFITMMYGELVLNDVWNRKSLTFKQKLQAVSDRFYCGGSTSSWVPKKGDYYTTVRNDLELYQIVDEYDGFLFTVYCHVDDCTHSRWKKDEFLNDFGKNRILVMDYIFDLV